MAKRDFYEVLGVQKDCQPGRDKEGLPPARHQASSRPQPGEQGRRGEVQGGHGGLRDPRRRAQAPDLRPVRLRRAQRHGPAHGAGLLHDLPGIRGHLRRCERHLRLFLRRRDAPGGARPAAAASAAPTCATTWRSASWRRHSASRRKSPTRARSAATCAREPARTRAAGESCAPPAAARARSAGTRASSPSPPPAPAADGEGEIIEKPCAECRGAGTLRKSRTITITIPAGIEDGKRLSLAGQGDAGANGAPDGDLYVFLRVQPHESFERDGKDVYCAIPISMTQAALGADIVVPTLDQKTVKVSIPAGTQNGRVIRLKGEGIPELHSTSRRGDMYVKIVVRIPTKLNAKAARAPQGAGRLERGRGEPSPDSALRAEAAVAAKRSRPFPGGFFIFGR